MTKKSKRILRILAWTLFGATVLFLLLHTPPARNAIKGILSRTVSRQAGGDLRIGRIMYRLWRGEVTLEEVEFEYLGLRAEVSSIEASLFSKGGLSIRIVDPQITLRDWPRRSQPEVRKAAPPWMILRHVGTIAVEDARLEWGSGKTRGELRGSLSLERHRTLDPSREFDWLLTGPVQGSVGDNSPIPLQLAADVWLQGKDLRVEEIRIDTGSSLFSAQGTLSQEDFITGIFSGGFEISDSLIRYFSPDLPVQESVAGRFQLEIRDSGFTNRVELEVPEVFLAGSGPWSARAESRIESRVVHLDSLSVSGYQGSIEIRGSFDLDRKEVEAEVEAQNLDVTSLASVWTELPVPIASTIGAEIRVSIKDWEIDSAEAQGSIRIDPLPTEGIPLSGRVDLKLSEQQLSFESKALRMWDGRMELSGQMRPDRLQARYEVRFPLSDLLSLTKILEFPVLPVEADGYLDVSGEFMGNLEDVSMNARVTSERLRLDSSDYSVKAEIELDQDMLRIKEAEILSDPGTLQIAGEIPIGVSGGNWDLSARLESLNLADFIGDFGYEMPAEGTLAIGGTREDPAWHGTLRAPVLDQELLSPKGMLSLQVQGRGNEIDLEELKVELGGGTLSASGQYQINSGSLTAQMKGSGFRLHEIGPVAERLNGLEGTASIEADIRGTALVPNVDLSLNLDNLSVNESPLPDLSFVLETDGEKAEFQGISGTQFLSGSCRLEDSFPLQLEVDLSALPLNELMSGFPDIPPLEISSAAGRIRVDLHLREPSTLSYLAEIEAIEATYGPRDWSISAFSIEGGLESFLVSGFHLVEGEDSLEMNGRVPLGLDGPLDLQLQGAMDLGLVSLLVPGSEWEGEANVQLQVEGTPEKPRVRGEATVSECRGKWEDFSWENLELRITGSEGGIRLDTLSLNSLDGSLEANGHLFRTNAGIDGKFSFQLDRMNLGALLPNEGTSAPVVYISGEGELAASELSLSGLTGSGRLTAIDADFQGSSASLQSPVEWNLESGSLSHSPVHFMGDKIDFSTTLSFDAGTTPPEWRFEVQGKVDPALANSFIADNNIRLSGEMDVKLDLRSREGNFLGQVSLEGGRVRLLSPSLTILRLQVQVSLQEELLEITKMQGEVGTGQIGISGRLTPEESGRLTKADLRIHAENVPLSLSDGIFGRFSGEMNLEGDARKYTLKGSVSIPRIVFRQELEPGTESLVLIERQLVSLDEETSLLELIALDLRAEIGDLQVDNSLAQLSADGALTIRGDLLTPRIDGSVRIKKGGTVEIGRGLVRIDEGRVTLDGYPESPLELTFIGMTRIRGTVIELDVRGRTDNLQTQISAPYDSNLTQGDLAVLLMTGRMPSAAVSEAGAVVTEELAASLGGMLQGQVGEKVYIDVSADQSLFSYGSDPTTRFSVGHQVAPNLYIIYSTSLKGTQTRGLLDYQPPQPFRLRYIVEEDGRHIVEANHTLGIRLKRQSKSGPSETGSQSRIHTLSFEGASPLVDKELRKLSRLKPGKRYDYWVAFQAAERIRSKLVKLGYRSALVDVEEHPLSSGEMDVVFALETGKRIQFAWTGDVPSKRFRNRIEALWDGRLSEDVLADTLARRAEYALRAEKYFQARVTPSLDRTEEEITVRFGVAEGTKGQRVVQIFAGNDSLPDAKLESALPKRDTADFFAAVGEESSMLRRTIHVLYASEGFLRGRVTDIRSSYSEESREFLVTIAVEEGPRAKVASVSLPPEAAEYTGPDAPHINLVPDTPFRIEDYMNSRTALYGFYSGEGYFQPQVSGILKPVDDKIAVLFTVEKGPLARVGEIRMARPSRIRQSRLEKLLTLKEGDQILPTELALSRKRLFETRAFQSVDIQTVPSEEGPEVRDVVVDLIDKPEVEVSYGLRYTLLNPTYLAESAEEKYSPFEVGGGLLFVNPFGFGQRYGASGYVFGKTQFYRLFYETDTFFGLRFPTQVILSQDWLKELQLSRVNSQINRITLQQHYLWGERTESLVGGERLRLQWNYSFRHIRLTYVDEQIPAYDTDRGSVSLSLIGDTRDNFVDPARGWFWSLTSEFASRWLGSDVNFTKLFAQGYLFVPLGEKMVLASGLRIGAVPGANPLLIIEDRFKAGGVYSVRGFPLYYLGPKNDLGEPLGGQAVFIFNQELRFPLYRSMYGGIFYDTGNVFALADLMRLGDLRHCAGVGLRYMLPFGPIRLDWAYVLDPKPGEDKYRFAFTIGHIF